MLSWQHAELAGTALAGAELAGTELVGRSRLGCVASWPDCQCRWWQMLPPLRA